MEEAIRVLRKFNPAWEGYREDQHRLHSVTMKALQAGEREIGIHLHIRGGKSMLIRMLSVHTVEQSLAAVCMAINNRSELRRQIVMPERWNEDFDRLETTSPRLPPYGFAHVRRDNEGKEGAGYWPDDPWPNTEYLLSTSIQTVCRNAGRMTQWVQSINNKSGLPIIVFLDEAQEYGVEEGGAVENVSKDWYPTLKRIQEECNVIFITLSGYPLRQDGLCLPGFIQMDPESENRRRWVRSQVIKELGPRSRLVEKNLINYVSQSYTMMPRGGEAFIVGMKRGFDTNALCQLHHVPVAHRVTYKENGKVILNDTSLVDLPEAAAKRVLGIYLGQDSVIEAMVKKTVELLADKRRAESSIKGLVYGMPDVSGGEEDAHLRRIDHHFARLAPSLKVRIVTQHSVESTSDALLAFCTDNHDVLILKYVGRVGFDCPRAKVLADLSTVRSEAKVAQTWLRVSTPYHNIPGDIITPGDCISDELFEKIVTNNGGNRSRFSSNAEVQKTVEAVEEDTDRDLIVGAQESLGVTAHDLTGVNAAQVALIEEYLAQYPAYHAIMQQMNMPARFAFVTLQMSEHGWRPSKTVLDERKHRYAEAHLYRTPIIDRLDKAAHKIAGTRSPYKILDEEQQHRWRTTRKMLLQEAKRFGSQPSDRELEQIQSLNSLEAMLVFLEQKVAE